MLRQRELHQAEWPRLMLEVAEQEALEEKHAS
jgi:hypothetical protein